MSIKLEFQGCKLRKSRGAANADRAVALHSTFPMPWAWLAPNGAGHLQLKGADSDSGDNQSELTEQGDTDPKWANRLCRAQADKHKLCSSCEGDACTGMCENPLLRSPALELVLDNHGEQFQTPQPCTAQAAGIQSFPAPCISWCHCRMCKAPTDWTHHSS